MDYKRTTDGHIVCGSMELQIIYFEFSNELTAAIEILHSQPTLSTTG